MDDPLLKEIHDTLETSKNLREGAKRADGTYGPVSAEHFHSYEYLVSLIARRQARSNELMERLTKEITVLTYVLAALAIVEVVKLFG